MATINLRMPDDLRDRFKAVCALRRTTMTAELLRLIKEEVDRASRKK